MSDIDPSRKWYACKHEGKYVEVVAGLPDHAAMVATGLWRMSNKDRRLIEVEELWRFNNGKECPPN